MHRQPEARRQSLHDMRGDAASSSRADPRTAFVNRLSRADSNLFRHRPTDVTPTVVPGDFEIVARIRELGPDCVDCFCERLIRRGIDHSDDDTTMSVDPTLDADRLEETSDCRALRRNDRRGKSELPAQRSHADQ